jgi:hypothetical protein
MLHIAGAQASASAGAAPRCSAFMSQRDIHTLRKHAKTSRSRWLFMQSEESSLVTCDQHATASNTENA